MEETDFFFCKGGIDHFISDAMIVNTSGRFDGQKTLTSASAEYKRLKIGKKSSN